MVNDRNPLLPSMEGLDLDQRQVPDPTPGGEGGYVFQGCICLWNNWFDRETGKLMRNMYMAMPDCPIHGDHVEKREHE